MLIDTRQTLTITRTFRGTAQQIYQAWTDATLLAIWCFPSDSELVECSADARVGGKWTCSFRSSNYVHSEFGEFLELHPYERIVQTLNNLDGFVKDALVQTVVTITINEVAPGSTELTFMQTGIPTPNLRNGLDEGWNDILDSLQIFLDRHPSEQE